MVFDLTKSDLAPPLLQDGFWFDAWSNTHIEPQADVLHRSFRYDSDGAVFTTFRQFDLCRLLIETIADSPLFLPEATLLIACGNPDGVFEYVANIQGLKLSGEIGAIQNVGVLPEYRRLGLGKALVYKALQGFHDVGIERVTLEVTVDNHPAVKLYEHIGFTTFNVYFKEIFD